MPPLLILLYVKIAITLVFVVLPFMLLSKPRLERIMGVKLETVGLVRLLGVGYFALCFGYAAAIAPVEQGVFPFWIALMGTVSNLGAALVLMFCFKAPIMRVGAAVFDMIGFCFLLSLFFQDIALGLTALPYLIQ